jgi:hypothetical protein
MGLQKPSIVKTKAVADVVFCFDCTGSMSDCIENVKQHVNKFVEGLNADQSVTIDWQMRAIGYGDLEEGEEIQNSNDFVSDVATFQAQVDGISMCGGGDAPESTLDAIIYAAKTSKWRKAHKIVVVFTDAQTKDIHTSTKTTFGINDIKSLMKDLTDNHIKLFLWGAEDPKYKELKPVPKSEITEMSSPNAELSSGANMAKLLELMGKTVSEETASLVL